MLEGLATILDTCISAVKAILERNEKLTKQRQQLALVTAYFCFLGIAKTGKELLNLAGDQPLVALQRMSVEELREFHALTQRHISIQLSRLTKLHNLIEDQHVLELFDTSLRQQILEAIGSKEKGLYSIGAALFFYFAFNTNPEGESTESSELERSANIICSMYPEIERGIISIAGANTGLSDLQVAALRYGEILRKIIPNDAFISLASEGTKLAQVEGESL